MLFRILHLRWRKTNVNRSVINYKFYCINFLNIIYALSLFFIFDHYTEFNLLLDFFVSINWSLHSFIFFSALREFFFRVRKYFCISADVSMFFNNLIAKSFIIFFNFIDASVIAALRKELLKDVMMTRLLTLFVRVKRSMNVSLLTQNWRMTGFWARRSSTCCCCCCCCYCCYCCCCCCCCYCCCCCCCCFCCCLKVSLLKVAMSLEELSLREYMQVKSSKIWKHVIMINSTLISIRSDWIKASSSFSKQLIVITRTLSLCEVTSSIALRRLNKLILLFFLSFSLFFEAFLRVLLSLTSIFAIVSSTDLTNFSPSSWRLIRSTLSISSSRTTQRQDSELNIIFKCFSVRVQFTSEMQ